jgi:hypothetical protein
VVFFKQRSRWHPGPAPGETVPSIFPPVDCFPDLIPFSATALSCLHAELGRTRQFGMENAARVENKDGAGVVYKKSLTQRRKERKEEGLKKEK